MSLRRYDPFFSSGFDDIFEPSPAFFSSTLDLMPVLASGRSSSGQGPNSVLRKASPGFEVNENDKQFQISMDLPGVRPQDANVELVNNGRVLHIHGGRKIVKENSVSETKFEKSFTIGDNIDKTKISANLADGVMTITAPKKEPEQPKTQKIAITSNPHPQLEDQMKE